MPTRYERVPVAYYIDNSDGSLDSVLVKLELHGIEVEQVDAPVEGLEGFVVSNVNTATRAFQDRYIQRVEGTWAPATVESGTLYRVRTDHRKRNLVFYLLEPTMDDGLFAWGFANAKLTAGSTLLYRQ